MRAGCGHKFPTDTDAACPIHARPRVQTRNKSAGGDGRTERKEAASKKLQHGLSGDSGAREKKSQRWSQWMNSRGAAATDSAVCP